MNTRRHREETQRVDDMWTIC